MTIFNPICWLVCHSSQKRLREKVVNLILSHKSDGKVKTRSIAIRRGHATVLFFIESEHKTRFDRQLCSLSILRIFLLRNGKQWYFYFLSYFWR